MSIPKKIHYCWFGGSQMKKDFLKNVETWKKYHPDYEVVRWDESNFDMDDLPEYIKTATDDCCYAILSDYARAKILYENGGWYLDTDVEVLQSFFDRYSEYNMVTPVEYSVDEKNEHDFNRFYRYLIDDEGHRNNGEDGFISGVAVCMSMIGAQPHCQALLDIMKSYDTIDYEKRDYPGCLFGGPIGPQIYAKALEKYGYVYLPKEQHLEDNILITGTEIMRNGEDENTYDGVTCAVHRCTFSWYVPYLSRGKRNKTEEWKSDEGTSYVIYGQDCDGPRTYIFYEDANE